MDIYREHILDHAQNQRNWQLLDPCDCAGRADNPLCGDFLELTLRIENNHINAVGWYGQGCAISQASASILGEHIAGWSLDELRQLTDEDMAALLKVPLSPSRRKCALLSLKGLNAALDNFEHTTEDGNEQTESNA